MSKMSKVRVFDDAPLVVFSLIAFSLLFEFVKERMKQTEACVGCKIQHEEEPILHIFCNEFRVASENHPTMLTETPMNPKTTQENTTLIIFHKFNMPEKCVDIHDVLFLNLSKQTT